MREDKKRPGFYIPSQQMTIRFLAGVLSSKGSMTGMLRYVVGVDVGALSSTSAYVYITIWM